MAVAFTRFFENLRSVLAFYEKYNENINLAFEETTLTKFIKIYNNTKKDNLINLLNTKESVEIRNFFFYLINFTKVTMQSIYNTVTLRYLTTKFNSALDADFNNILTIRLALFVCFNLLIFILYFLLWIPLTEKLINDVSYEKIYLCFIF